MLEQHPAMPRQRWENWWRAQRQQQQQPLRPQSQREEQQQQHDTVDLCATAVEAAAACKAAASRLVSLVQGRLDVREYMISCSLTFADRRQRRSCRCRCALRLKLRHDGTNHLCVCVESTRVGGDPHCGMRVRARDRKGCMRITDYTLLTIPLRLPKTQQDAVCDFIMSLAQVVT